MKQSADFDTTIAGIPCGIKVFSYNRQEPWSGSAYTCPSSDDYYGYVEFDFIVLDRKGYEAYWLYEKMTENDENRILKEYEESICEPYFE